MVWLKLSDDFGDDCARFDLSDAAFRTHTEGLLWTMNKLTAGRVSTRGLRRFAETADPDAAVRELVSIGWWTAEPDGWQIRRHMEHQRTPEQVDEDRAKTAKRVAKWRAGKRAPDGNAVTNGVSNASRNGVSTGLVWSGLDREVQETNPALEEDASSPASHDDTAGF